MKKIIYGLFSLCLLTVFPFNIKAGENELIYGEDIPAGEESVWFYEKDEVIEDAYTDLTQEQANDIKLELEKDGYTKVTIKTYSVKTGTEIKNVTKSFESYDLALEYVKTLEKDGYTVRIISLENNTTVETRTIKQTYETLSEATSALESFIEKYDNVRVEKDKTPIKTDEVIETILGETPYYKEEDAQKALEAYIEGNETDGYYFTGKLRGPLSGAAYEESLISMHFDSYDDAMKYISSLMNDGYSIDENSINFENDTHEEIKNIINEDYETEAKAQEELNKYIDTYKIDQTKSIDKVENGNDNIDPFEFTTDDEEEAIKYYNDKINLNDSEKGIIVTANKDSVNTQTKEISFIYENENEKDTILAGIEKDYDVVEDYEVNTVDAGTVYEAVTITADKKVYDIGETTYILIKKGNEYFVWTRDELTIEEQNTFRNTYKKIATDKVITGEIIASNKTKFIYGLKEYQSANKKLFTFVEVNGELKIKMASGAESRVVTGKYINKTNYNLVAKVHNINYIVTGNILTKGYSYRLNFHGKKIVTDESGTLTATKNVYYFDVDKKDKDYEVSATGEETIQLDSHTLVAETEKDIYEDRYSVDITKQLFAFGGGEGGSIDEETAAEERKDFPNTGVETSKLPQIVLSLASILLAIMLRRRIK